MKPAVAIASLALLACACNQAELQGPPPTEDAGFADACSPDPVATCDGSAPADPRCTGDPASSDPIVKRLPTAAVGLGCVVNVPDPVPNEYGECLITAACTCVGARDDAGPDAGPWVCKR